MIQNDVRSYSVATVDYNDFASCPDDYKHYVVRILSMQAYAELMGATQMSYHLKLAPDSISRKRLAKIIYDEASHAHLLYEILRKIGVSEQEAIQIAEGGHLSSGKTDSMEGAVAVGDDDNTWIDLVLNNFFLDRAGLFMVGNFSKSSFKPWSNACEVIYKDELWHVRFGLDELTRYLETHLIDDVKIKFAKWYVRALNFFGPSVSRSHELLKTYGIKRLSNAELRQQFISDITHLLGEKHWLSLLPVVSEHYPYHHVKHEEK